MHFQSNTEYWYPQKLIFHHKINIKKGKAFKKSEYLSISKKHIFNVEKLQLSRVDSISTKNEYNHQLPFENQVKPMDGIEWENISVVND